MILLLNTNFVGQEKPEEAFGKRFIASGSFREFFLTFGDGSTTEPDSLLGVKD